MDAYGAEIFRFCLQHVGHREPAADVHQTVFIQAFRDLRRFRGDSSFRVWLYAIARHRCLDWLKGQRPRAAREVAVERLPEDKVASDDIEERTWRGELSRALRRCLGELEPRSRAAVLLRFQQELSHPEIESVSGDARGHSSGQGDPRPRAPAAVSQAQRSRSVTCRRFEEEGLLLLSAAGLSQNTTRPARSAGGPARSTSD